MSASASHVFTAAQIARALGCSRQNIHQQLAAVPADGEQLVSGNLAKAWKIESLPAPMMCQLSKKAEAKGYRAALDLLRDPFAQYEPEIPFAEIAPEAIEKALKLRSAVQQILPLRDDRSISAAKLAELGVAAYQREFGHTVNARHWRALFDRTIERDNGAEEWSRVEIYLDDKPPRRRTSNIAISVARERGFEIIEDALASFVGRTQITVEEKRLLWLKACDELQVQIAGHKNEGRAEYSIITKRAKHAIVNVLIKSGFVGATATGVAKTLNRKWAVYLTHNGKVPADARTARFANIDSIPVEDFNRLVARSLDCGGRRRQAFRELRDAGELSEQTLSNTIANPSRKSYIPARIDRQIAAEVKRLMPIHHGPREHQLRGAYNTRDYSGMFAGDSYQADDVTCPVYYWEPAATRFGFRIIRGQLILMIDERSRLALGFALHSENNYNARIIRALITRVHDGFGLPRRRFYFERGIWRSSRILTGGDELALDHTELGLREFGVKFVHAKLPRGKVIERILGLAQNAMERLPGYAGRDEVHDRFERVQEQKRTCEGGTEHPSKFFLSKPQWESELSRILDDYNSERQEGTLKALSPIEAWNRFQSPEPQINLGVKARYLLAHHKVTMKVQRSGIVLRPSLGGGTYCDETTGRFAGERMLVWVNPEDLGSVALTTLDRKKGPFVVPRLEPLPAIDPSPEQFDRSASQIEAHNSVARTTYRLISEHLVRRNFRALSVDESTVALGEQIEVGADEVKAQKQTLQRNIRAIATRSRQLGMQIPLHHRNGKSVDRVAVGADLIAESRRLRETEENGVAVESAISAESPKTYVLDAPSKSLSQKQRSAIYWRTWNAAEKAKPGINRFAITHRVLGAVVKIQDMTDEQFIKVIHVFESIAKNKQQ